jgi:hypothetical protein
MIPTAFFLAACVGMVSACSSRDSKPSDESTGGAQAASAGQASGGATTGSGGKSAPVAGQPSASGGSGGLAAGEPGVAGAAVATGGQPAVAGTGGAGGVGSSATGGAGAAGGRVATGGTTAIGGAGAAGGAEAAAGASAGGAGGGPLSVENESADCAVGTLPEPSALPQIPKLPDPFLKLDGTRVTSKDEWRCRRQEIRKQAEKYIFGGKPNPDLVSGTVTNTQISVHVEALGKKIDFNASVVLPTKGAAPYPAIISVGSKGGLTLGESRILEQGVAVIYYNNYDLGKEGTPEASRDKPNPGKYYDIYGGDDPAGLLMAWAWGASRLLDVMHQSGGNIFDLKGIGVTGCSRLGKSAFTIGVFDDRIALTIPHEPSTGGDPALRIMDKLPGGERTDYNYYGLNWLSNNFAPFVFANNTSNAVKLPIDTHALIGMMAPRGVLILENPHQAQMGAPAGHMATLGGLEVYKALGFEKNVSYHSAVAETAHCSYKNEYTELVNASIAAFLKHEADPPGQILVGSGSGGSVPRADWIDWTAPELR